MTTMAVRRICCKTVELFSRQIKSSKTLQASYHRAHPPSQPTRTLPAAGKHTILIRQCYSTRGHEHKDFYSVMGVSPHATQQQIKEAYYRLSMKYHPDRNKGSEEAHRKFTEIAEAYSVLGQYDSRRKYDKGLLHQYPRQPHHTHTPGSGAPASKTTVHGSKVKFDFDEFYRAHYGEALRRERAARKQREAARERARTHTISNSWQQVFIFTVTVSVLLVGWYGYRWQQNRTDVSSQDQSV